ncbi:MAG: heme exporter protein CcmD [Methylophaga sp.]|nr:heme exporter protein CcmD [Methylophaga sp.]
MGEFFYMGGYAFHVWTSYALAFVVLFINIVGPSMRHKRNIQSASDFQQHNGTISDDT